MCGCPPLRMFSGWGPLSVLRGRRQCCAPWAERQRVISPMLASPSSAKSVGDGYLTATAQGVFVIFTLSVRNIGDESRSFSGSNQKLIDW